MISQITSIASTTPHTRARSNARALVVVEKYLVRASIVVSRLVSRPTRASRATDFKRWFTRIGAHDARARARTRARPRR